MVTSKRRRFEGALVALGLVLTCAPAGLAQAKKFEVEYAQGVAAYKKRDYATATGLFWNSITDGNGSASVWLYRAHSMAGEGKLQAARDAYVNVVNIYKGTDEAKAAAAYIKALDAKTWHPGPAAGAAPTPAQSAAKAALPATPAAGSSFRTRIEIIAPRAGHEKVSAQTINIIRQAIDRLPKPIYKTLDDGVAKVSVAPNIIDIWPDTLSQEMPGQPELSIAQEPGRTYVRDIHIYERSIVTKGSRELGPVRPVQEIQATFLHEVGHALDDCMGQYSKDPGLVSEYKIDCDGLRDDAKVGMETYLQYGEAGPAEACAESVGILLGGGRKNAEQFKRNFPRTMAWVKSKVKL